MKHLEVILNYGTADSHSTPGSNLALPVRALDTDGSVLAEGVASVLTPAVLDLPDTTQIAFVRLTWPSGRTETQRATFDEGSSQQAVIFTDARIYRNEWSAWAVPKLNPRSPLMMSGGEEALNLDLNRFKRTWLRLWKFVAGAWTREELKPQMSYRSDAAWQIDLTLESVPWMLQIGGSNVTWRFVSLPGGGPARVLMTPKDSRDPRADALKVVLTSFRTDAETLLEFLSRDAMRAAETLADSAALATRLFSDKFTDPVSALAGAYYLLRLDQWSRVPLRWFENLSTSFPWLPDAAVIHCVRLLRAGVRTEDEREEARTLLARSLECGWPVYAKGSLYCRKLRRFFRSAWLESASSSTECAISEPPRVGPGQLRASMDVRRINPVPSNGSACRVPRDAGDTTRPFKTESQDHFARPRVPLSGGSSRRRQKWLAESHRCCSST